MRECVYVCVWGLLCCVLCVCVCKSVQVCVMSLYQCVDVKHTSLLSNVSCVTRLCGC